jgi:hypothetical protein
VNGACTGDCTPGAVQCSGNSVETCGADGTWGTPADCNYQTCVAGVCTGVCGPEETSCSGAQPLACSAAGAWTNAGSPCAQPTPDCAAGLAYVCGCNGTTCNDCSGSTCTSVCVEDELTDPKNCGACGVACAAGPCTAGQCDTTIAANLYEARGLALSATTLAFTYSNAVLTVPVGGGTPTTIGCGASTPSEVALDAANVYFTTFDGNVMKAPIGGATATTLASGQVSPGPLVVDAKYVYWTNAGPFATGYAGSVGKVAIAGGSAVTVLASGLDEPTAIAIDANNVYFGTADDSTLWSVPLAGGTPTSLAAAEDTSTIVVRGSNLYVGTLSGLLELPLTGGPATTNVNVGAVFAMDTTSLYWTTPTGVLTSPIAGGKVSALASGQSGPLAIAVGPSNVYWVTNGTNPNYVDGTVMSTAK